MKKRSNYKVSDLSPHLFWDVDSKTLDFRKDSDYIIDRVALLGGLEDWQILRRVYGDKKIKSVILGMKYLDDKSLHFYSLIFNTPKERFRCYKLRQSKKIHFPF